MLSENEAMFIVRMSIAEDAEVSLLSFLEAIELVSQSIGLIDTTVHDAYVYCEENS